MAAQNQVHHIPCTSADDFLEAISPRSAHLKGAVDRWPHFFIFRGHADDRWKLIPKALRLDQKILGMRGWGSVKETTDSNDSTKLIGSFFYQDNPQATGVWSIKEQVDAEWRMLKRFFEFADMNGLPLPEDSPQLRRLLLETSFILEPAKVEGWPRMEFLSLLARGQHYGVIQFSHPMRDEPKQIHPSEPRIDRSAFSVFSSFEEADAADRAYWHSRTPEERVCYAEYLRRINYGSRATERLQRVLEIATRPRR